MDKRLFTVIKKELKRIFTDRRLVFTTMILPALSIYVMYSLMGQMINSRVEDVETNIPTVVAVEAPESFKDFLEVSGRAATFDIDYDRSDIETIKEEIKSGDTELLLIFDNSFDKKAMDFSNPNVERYFNGIEEYSGEARWNMDNTLRDYEAFLLGNRIGNHDHVNVFDLNRGVEKDTLHDDQKATGKGLSNLFPMLIAILLFSGAMSVGPDMIAGEKERGTMATLLVTPVKRETLAMGKVIALSVVAIVSAASSFVGIIASMPKAGSIFADEGIDMASLAFGVNEYLSLAGIMVTLVALYVAIVCTVSIISKSIKEANTYMAPIYMLIMLVGFTTMFSDGSSEMWRFMIPVYGSINSLKQLFAFELTTNMVLYTCGSQIVLAGILVFAIKILFNNEKVMFSK
jgi:sodium transport system permease protein